MIEPAKLAKLSVGLAQLQMEMQRLRISRQHKLIEKLQSQNHGAMGMEARQSLKKMEVVLERLNAKLAAANEELFQATVDEPSLEKVERDCPM